MAVGTNRWKLGLFVIAGFALALTALVVFGAQRFNDRTVACVSFFDESVQGLEVGSPVKFRGVTIGRVAAIDVAPDQRHVEVSSELSVAALDHSGLRSSKTGERSWALQPKLRVQLSQTGITGVKFLLLDFFEGVEPPEKLPFKVPEHTIPSTPSTMKNLEASLVRATNQFPDIAGSILGTATKLDTMMATVEAERLPNRAGGALSEMDAAMRELKTQLAGLRTAALSAQAEQQLALLNTTLTNANRMLERMDSEKGFMRSAERAASSMHEVARGAQAVGPELELTLREIRAAARSFKHFIDALERDPDMLIKGRAATSR